jgi:hypothetical protein
LLKIELKVRTVRLKRNRAECYANECGVKYRALRGEHVGINNVAVAGMRHAPVSIASIVEEHGQRTIFASILARRKGDNGLSKPLT